jgi:hypothetical protein
LRVQRTPAWAVGQTGCTIRFILKAIGLKDMCIFMIFVHCITRTIFGDGLKECTFAIVAYLIEKIVGLLGTIMGKVLDDQKNDVDGSLPHKKGDIKMLEMEGIWNFCATVFEMA